MNDNMNGPGLSPEDKKLFVENFLAKVNPFSQDQLDFLAVFAEEIVKDCKRGRFQKPETTSAVACGYIIS